MTAAIREPITAAPRREGETKGQEGAGHKSCRERVQALFFLGKSHRFWCPRGDSAATYMGEITGELLVGADL
jgi:hypothetical protein